jgi:hypothetical protein
MQPGDGDQKRDARSGRPSKRLGLEESRAANLAEADRLRRARYERWGIDPDVPDAEAQWLAEGDRRNRLVQDGWTFIRGRQELAVDWRAAVEAQADAVKAEEARQRAEAKAARHEQPQPRAGDPERDWM